MTETMGNSDEQNEVTESSAETIQDRSFSQDEVDAIVKARLAKYSKKYDDIDLSEYKALKTEQENKKLEDQKARGEFEQILTQQKSDFDNKINSMKQQLEKERVDGSLLKAAGSRNAVNPEQVAQLLRSKVRLTDEGDVTVLNDKGEVVYDTEAGSLQSVESLVNTFLDSNPHFLRAGPSGSGSTGNVGEDSSTELDIANLDMSNPAHRQIYAEHKLKLRRR